MANLGYDPQKYQDENDRMIQSLAKTMAQRDQAYGNALQRQRTRQNQDWASKAAKFASLGALAGSIIPGVGTGLGAGIGAALGGGLGLYQATKAGGGLGHGWDKFAKPLARGDWVDSALPGLMAVAQSQANKDPSFDSNPSMAPTTGPAAMEPGFARSNFRAPPMELPAQMSVATPWGGYW